MRLRTVLATFTAGLAAAASLTAAGTAHADSATDHACSPAVSIDRFSDALDKTTYPLLDNIEGMVITGHARGGRLKVLLVSDDNQNAVQTTRFLYLRVRV